MLLKKKEGVKGLAQEAKQIIRIENMHAEKLGVGKTLLVR